MCVRLVAPFLQIKVKLYVRVVSSSILDIKVKLYVRAAISSIPSDKSKVICACG